MSTDLSSVLSQCTRLTDGRTDGELDRQTFLITIPHWHSMQRRKTAVYTSVNTDVVIYTSKTVKIKNGYITRQHIDICWYVAVWYHLSWFLLFSMC